MLVLYSYYLASILANNNFSFRENRELMTVSSLLLVSRFNGKKRQDFFHGKDIEYAKKH